MQQVQDQSQQLAALAHSDALTGTANRRTWDLALPPADLTAALARVDARYAPECLSACELAVYCRHEASGTTAALGRPVRDALGGIESVAEVLDLVAGRRAPTAEQAEAALLLKAAARLRAEALSA